jgi:3-oxoacyl-[acyl-carrier protein] reductase
VVVADIDTAYSQSTARAVQQRGAEALALTVDVSSRADVTAMAQQTLERFGRLDILVNNAGISPLCDFEEITDAEWDRVLDVNLKGPFLCTQAAIQPMVERRWGRIIMISSVAGKIGGRRTSVHYAASKGGIIPMTFCLARQYARHGITANVITPGQIETDMTSGWTDETKQGFVASIPLGRMGQPSDVAATVAFLASEAAAFITGEIIDVNGGYLMD